MTQVRFDGQLQGGGGGIYSAPIFPVAHVRYRAAAPAEPHAWQSKALYGASA